MARTDLTQVRDAVSTPRSAVSSVRTDVITCQNYIIQSEDQSAANWVKQNCTVVTNQAANAYDGTLTMDKITDDAVLANHRPYVTSTILKEHRTYTFSIDWKDVDIGFAQLYLDMGSGGNTVQINLTTGAITLTTTAPVYNFSLTGAVRNMGGGIYKIVMTMTMKINTAAPYISCGLCSSGTIAIYSGTGKSAYLGRVRLVQGNWEGPDCPTTGAAVNIGAGQKIRDLVT